MTGAVTFQPRVQRARVPEMGSKYASRTLSPDLLAVPVPPPRAPPPCGVIPVEATGLRTVSPPRGPADAQLDGKQAEG